MALEDGQPFVLEGFQRRMVSGLFEGARESVVLVPKKNGKSTLLGALALYHLCSTPDAECIIVAASRDQAQIMLRQAQGFIRRSEGLQKRLSVKQREIVHRTLGGRIRVLASDVDTADGVIPTLVLVDELHRHKSADLYGVLRDGLGPRDGRMVTISTAGSDEFSALGELRTKAYEMDGLVRDGAYRYGRSPDGAFALYEWALDPGEDVDDMEVVKAANPASWQTVEELRLRHDSPSMTPWQWKRFACGIWIQPEEAWITAEDWDACKGEPTFDATPDSFMGVDIGGQKDAHAMVTAQFDPGGVLQVRAEILTPTDTYKPPVSDVRERIGVLNGGLRLREVVYDPWHFKESAEILEQRGLRMVGFPQNNERMCPASETLFNLIKERRLVHDGDPELRRHVLSAVAGQTNRGWRIDKKKSKKRIDACVALAMAADRASASQNLARVSFVEVFS